MKNKIIILVSLWVLSIISTAFAVGPGVYAGLDVGTGSTQLKSTSGTKKTTTSNNGLTGGINLGYQFNNFGAFELGYIHWVNGKSTQTPLCGSPVIHNDSLNVLGKGMFHIANLSLFGKAGVGVLRYSGGGSCTTTTKPQFTFKPVVGIGTSFDLTQRWVAELSYTRIFINSKLVSNANLLAVGISYHWADEYCGQFLC